MFVDVVEFEVLVLLLEFSSIEEENEEEEETNFEFQSPPKINKSLTTFSTSFAQSIVTTLILNSSPILSKSIFDVVVALFLEDEDEAGTKFELAAVF